MKKHFLNYLIIPALLILTSSCNGYKNIPYFQDINRATIQNQTIDNYKALTIQPDDILDITVTSLNSEASTTFNGSPGQTPTTTPDKGYLVDQNGNIVLPLVGTFKVAGLTTTQIHDQLLPKLTTVLKEPVLTVRLSNFKFSVVGDVAKPGLYVAPKEKLNLVEAISLAGDLNITAKRENILLIRETKEKREFITLDLTKGDIFHSPYYYLKNNDILYIKPDKTKYTSVSDARSNVTLGVSILSIAALLISILRLK